MEKCSKCGNYIPQDMKICPHCGLLPPTLWPHFYVYALLTVIAIVCAVYFRPFASGPVVGQVSRGALWAAFVIFVIFGIIFLGVSIILLNEYRHRTYRGKLTKAERQRFVLMKQHIEANKHVYEEGLGYCTVCGKKKPDYLSKKK